MSALDVFARIQDCFANNTPAAIADLLTEESVVEWPFTVPGAPTRLVGAVAFCEYQQHSQGTLVFVALPADNFVQLPIFETVLNGITIVGSIVGTRVDLAEVYELHAAGRTHVMYEKRNLEDINEAMEDVEKGRVTARLVFDLMSSAESIREPAGAATSR